MKINPKIFKEYDIRGQYPAEISERTAFALGLAFARLIKEKKIIVGRDARPESEKVFWPLIAGLSEGGLKVFDLGVCATPELFFAVGAKKFPGGVMVTASHSPQGQTGFKFCDSRGRVYGLKTGLKRLARLADYEIPVLPAKWQRQPQKKSVEFVSIATDYKKFALSFIKPAAVADLKIAIDASGGSGGHLADVVLRALPLKFAPLNFRANDRYPDHGPNPLLTKNRRAAAQEVKKIKAALGVVLDGDADRAVFIDETGSFVQPYYINCLLAKIFLAMKKGATIAVDARLNLAIARVIKENGGKILVHRSGYANFIQTMTAKKLLLGLENSGHTIINFALKKNSQYVYGDSIIPVLLLLKYLKKNNLTLGRAIALFKEQYAISGELNFTVADFTALKSRLKKKFSGAKCSQLDGLSVWGKSGDWFFNIRPSHTEPVVRLNIEAAKPAKLKQLKREIAAIISKNK